MSEPFSRLTADSQWIKLSLKMLTSNFLPLTASAGQECVATKHVVWVYCLWKLPVVPLTFSILTKATQIFSLSTDGKLNFHCQFNLTPVM